MLPPTPNPSRIRTFRPTSRAARRGLFRAVAAVVGSLLLVALAAAPAGAHGGLESPVSRQAACGPEGGQADRSPACAAAIAATGGNRLEDWDNVRLADVGGRDREVVPDGQLCSAGLEQFAGLDAARTDWPTTTLPAGGDYTFRYRATIPHQGTFRLYVTADGYDPTQPLAWADLEPEPFLTVTDPPLANGAYTIDGQLPQGKAGQHLIYTVWQNSDTPDTYYSCSDVFFAGSAAAGAGAGAGAETSATPAAQPAPESSPAAAAPAESANATAEQNVAFPWILGAAVVFILIGLSSYVLRRSRW